MGASGSPEVTLMPEGWNTRLRVCPCCTCLSYTLDVHGLEKSGRKIRPSKRPET